MLTQYLREAMKRASYEILDGNEGFYGAIPDLDGVWANESTLEACRERLQEMLEDWLLFRLTHQMPVPQIGGIDLAVTEAA